MTEKKPSYIGHRKRVRDRYLQEGLDSFTDVQVLELLLFFAKPYVDTKPLAQELLDRYGSLAAVLNAPVYDLQTITGIGEHLAVYLHIFPDILRRYQLSKMEKKPLLQTAEQIGEYALALFAPHKYEAFYLLCLDASYHLLAAELVAEGSLSEVAVYPRVLMERALVHRAKTVVLLHNHPSEELRPSSYDLDLTRSIVNLMQGVAINVLDHLIVGSDRWFSFRESGLFWHTQSGLQKSSLQLAEGEEDPAAIFYIKEG